MQLNISHRFLKITMSFTRLLLKHAFCCLPQTRGTLQQLLRDRSKEDPTLLISYSYIKHLKSPLSRRSTGTHRPSFLHHSECPALKQQNIHKKKKSQLEAIQQDKAASSLVKGGKSPHPSFLHREEFISSWDFYCT